MVVKTAMVTITSIISIMEMPQKSRPRSSRRPRITLCTRVPRITKRRQPCYKTSKTKWSWSKESSETKRWRRETKRSSSATFARDTGLSSSPRPTTWLGDCQNDSYHHSWRAWRRTSIISGNTSNSCESASSSSRLATARTRARISTVWLRRWWEHKKYIARIVERTIICTSRAKSFATHSFSRLLEGTFVFSSCWSFLLNAHSCLTRS